MKCYQSVMADWGLIVSVAALSIAAASFWSTRRMHILAPKRDVLRRLLGNRHLLTKAMVDSLGPGEPFIALNEIPVVYNRDVGVVRALKIYFVEKSNGNLNKLIREMGKAAHYKLDTFDDNFLETPFIPRARIARPDTDR